jgi:hypothetical protein
VRSKEEHGEEGGANVGTYALSPAGSIYMYARSTERVPCAGLSFFDGLKVNY